MKSLWQRLSEDNASEINIWFEDKRTHRNANTTKNSERRNQTLELLMKSADTVTNKHLKQLNQIHLVHATELILEILRPKERTLKLEKGLEKQSICNN